MSNNSNTNETLEAQIMRVHNEMLDSGEVKKKIIDGEECYALTMEGGKPVAKMVKKDKKKSRTAAAHKAWATRRKATEVKFKPIKTTTKAAQVNVDIDKLKRACAGQRAAITRKLNIAKKALHTNKIGK
jgi:glutaredoxin 2